MLIGAVVFGQYYYQSLENEKEVRAVIADMEAGKQVAPLYSYETPQKRLERIVEEREISKIAGPIAIVAPPIVIYLLGAAIVWVVAGFKADRAAE